MPKKVLFDRPRYFQPLLITVLAVGGFCKLIVPTLADGTAPGTPINNTATATYTDSSGTSYTSTSNQVTVTVAEVAGISVQYDSAVGTPQPNDTVEFIFNVTNTGNDPTRFYIPGTDDITLTGTSAANATVSNIQVDYGTGYVDLSTLTNNLTPSIAVGTVVKVKVFVQLNNNATGTIGVQFGDTGNNDNSTGTQNQPDTADNSAAANDVRTVDNPDNTPNETANPPANGEREASATSNLLTISAISQAFATVFKQSAYTPNGADLTDDVITYTLNMRVNSNPPATGYTAADLTGTNITVENQSVDRILIADAIPTNTVLTSTPTAIAGWTIVYTDADPSTTDANAVNWQTDVANLSNPVTRVGFIFDGTLPANNTLIGNFTFSVVTSGVTEPTQIANIAQLFGRTSGNTTPGFDVYDESGDQNPNNFNGTNPPIAGDNTLSGIANPTAQGVDRGNNNGGDTTNTNLNNGGEANVVQINAPGSLLNGPNDSPDATGPSGGQNDDFTNLAVIPQTDPDPIIFTNEILNSGSTPLNQVKLIPVGVSSEPLPDQTKVTIRYDSSTAIYIYNASTNTFSLDPSSPLSIVALPPIGENDSPTSSLEYTVEVDLPPGAPVSTTIGRGFGVQIYAFDDADNDNVRDTNEPQNATINRVYTGFLRLEKRARILDNNGNQVFPATTGQYTTDLSATSILPGYVIEYQVTYTNMSIGNTAPALGNSTLSASDVQIVENGNTSPNNWATYTTNIVGTAQRTIGTIIFNPGNSDTTSVTEYINDLGTEEVDPGESGTFSFRRRVN